MQVGGPGERHDAGARRRTKPSRPCSASSAVDCGLIGLGGRRSKGERDFAEAQLEQPIAAAGLAVIVALRCRAAQDLDLPVVEAKAAIDRRDLRLDRPLVRQE